MTLCLRVYSYFGSTMGSQIISQFLGLSKDPQIHLLQFKQNCCRISLLMICIEDSFLQRLSCHRFYLGQYVFNVYLDVLYNKPYSYQYSFTKKITVVLSRMIFLDVFCKCRSCQIKVEIQEINKSYKSSQMINFS